MAISDITLSALTATPTLRGNKLKATVVATGPAANIPSLQTKTVIFYSSVTNDFTTATEVARGNPEALDAGLIEEQTYYYWARAVNNSDSLGAVFPVSPTGGVACTAIGMSGLAFGLANGKIVASVAANALTIAIKTAAGNDPSASDPVYVAFRNATLATGNYIIRQINAALSLTMPSGATAGFISLDPSRLWLSMFDVGDGAVKLAARNCSTSTGVIHPLPKQGIDTTVLNDTSADNAGVFYADAVLTSKPFFVAASCDWNSGLTTAGTWTTPDVLTLHRLGDKLPGDVIQQSFDKTSSVVSIVNGIPLDNTIPQRTEGTQVFSRAMTIQSPCSIMESSITANFISQVADALIMSLCKIGTANAIVAYFAAVASGVAIILTGRHLFRAPGAGSMTFTAEMSCVNGGLAYLNGTTAGNPYLGGAAVSSLILTERIG